MDNLPQRTHFEAGPNVSISQKFPILIAKCPLVNKLRKLQSIWLSMKRELKIVKFLPKLATLGIPVYR